MAENFKVDKNTSEAAPENSTNNANNSGGKVIDEALELFAKKKEELEKILSNK